METINFMKENMFSSINSENDYLNKICGKYLYSIIFSDKESKTGTQVIDIFDSLVDDNSYVVSKVEYLNTSIEFHYYEFLKKDLSLITKDSRVKIFYNNFACNCKHC